jgi:hypothetical protein
MSHRTQAEVDAAWGPRPRPLSLAEKQRRAVGRVVDESEDEAELSPAEVQRVPDAMRAHTGR